MDLRGHLISSLVGDRVAVAARAVGRARHPNNHHYNIGHLADAAREHGCPLPPLAALYGWLPRYGRRRGWACLRTEPTECVVPNEPDLLGALALSRWADDHGPELRLRRGGLLCPIAPAKEVARAR